MEREALSTDKVASGRGEVGAGPGAGEVGRLFGRNKEDGRRACIIVSGND